MKVKKAMSGGGPPTTQLLRERSADLLSKLDTGIALVDSLGKPS